MNAPDALLLLSSHCPHCPAVLQALGELVKTGAIGRLEVVNVEARPEVAAAHGVRSVPWTRIGPFAFGGVRSREELAQWAARADSPEGFADYFHVLLKEGGLAQVLDAVAQAPERMAALLPVIANPEAAMNVRLGASVVFERHAGSTALRQLVPQLGELAAHGDHRVRADACHILGLSQSPAARAYLEPLLTDDDAEVREIAAESLDALK